MTEEIVIKYDGILSESFYYIKFVEKDDIGNNTTGFTCWAGGCWIGPITPYKTPTKAKEFIAKRIRERLKITKTQLKKQLTQIENCLSSIKGKEDIHNMCEWLEQYRVKKFNYEK